MSTVKDLLKSKGSHVHSISPDAKVYEALKLMADEDIGALVVLQDEKLIGIFSERDYARKIILKGKFSKDTQVREVMASQVVYVSENQTVEECMVLMTHKRFRHLPVLEGKKIVGVISIGDVVKSIISSRNLSIEQLTHYIKGSL